MSDAERIGGGMVSLVLVLVIGILMGASIEQHSWEKRIVDEPEVVAVIKSRILAERNEKEVRGQ